MNDNHVNLIADSIVYAVQNEKAKLTAILLKNGVVVPSGTSDANLILLVSEVLKKSNPFRNDFINLIASNEYVSSNFSNFSSYSNAAGELNVLPEGNEPPAKPASTSFWTTANLTALLNKAADTYSTVSTNQANTALANAATVRAQTGATDSPVAAVAAPKSSNTTLYIILGIIAVGAIGGFIWYKNNSKK
jgi:cobalamin biosynthesis Mg chelatase CobN